MKCLRQIPLVVLFVVIGYVVPVWAVSVSVDLDPGSLGIQGTATVTPGSTLVIDVVVEDLVPSSPLNAFEFDMDFDPTILDATNIATGEFLLPPSLVVETNILLPDINFAEVTLLATGASGSGVLATVTFDVVGLGMSTLDLNDVILSAPFGVAIMTDVSDGKVISNNVNVIPEPASALLWASGLLGLIFTRELVKRISGR